jgi:hypothetical protein
MPAAAEGGSPADLALTVGESAQSSDEGAS